MKHFGDEDSRWSYKAMVQSMHDNNQRKQIVYSKTLNIDKAQTESNCEGEEATRGLGTRKRFVKMETSQSRS